MWPHNENCYVLAKPEGQKNHGASQAAVGASSPLPLPLTAAGAPDARRAGDERTHGTRARAVDVPSRARPPPRRPLCALRLSLLLSTPKSAPADSVLTLIRASRSNRNLPQQLTLDHVSPATRLLEKRRHMFEVQEALDAQKEEFQRREATFKRREEMLKQKDLELQESLIKFNKFLQENDSKRTRAQKKQVDESRQRAEKEREIVRLQEVVAEHKIIRGQMEEEVKKMSQYQAYLDEVLEVEEEHSEIAELLGRYETLYAAHADLIERQEAAARENEEEQRLLYTFIREKTDEILGYNNLIAELQQAAEKRREEAQEQEEDGERQMSTVAERTLQLGQVLMACDNIYARCAKESTITRKTPKAASEGKEAEIGVIVEKLGLIRDYITDLQDITVRLARKAPATPKGDGATGAGAPPSAPAADAKGGGDGGGRSSMHMSTAGGASKVTGSSEVRVSRADHTSYTSRD